jgi:phenylpyruvate tautomerase PptA (4-oxalocrotonate tautomerase family)
MPLIALQVTEDTHDSESLMKSLSAIIARITGKPEKFCMVTVTKADIILDRSGLPAAYADIRAIGGLNAGICREISHDICAILAEDMGIPKERSYITFSDIPADRWGWDGKLFG